MEHGNELCVPKITRSQSLEPGSETEPTNPYQRYKRAYSLPTRDRSLIPPIFVNFVDGDPQEKEEEDYMNMPEEQDTRLMFIGFLLSIILFMWSCLLQLISDSTHVQRLIKS